ncbi:MAG: hypothetical protein CFE46_18585 [Burkholderiales bacterium PBB6]|nr:MAG: hypothetical protein CFE46_18585 [Burkholderiales bacterium PBB6]
MTCTAAPDVDDFEAPAGGPSQPSQPQAPPRRAARCSQPMPASCGTLKARLAALRRQVAGINAQVA